MALKWRGGDGGAVHGGAPKWVHSKSWPRSEDLVMKKVDEVSVYGGFSDNITKKRSASFGAISAATGSLAVPFGWIQRRIWHSNCR